MIGPVDFARSYGAYESSKINLHRTISLLVVEQNSPLTRSNPEFATTQWTLVWKAAAEDSQVGRPALGELMRTYWQPLYAFARRRGLNSEDAEDATQEFLSRIVDGNLLESADPAKGKFRSFMITAWKRFLIDEYRKQQAEKRGGLAATISIDASVGERQWTESLSRESDADRVFMKSWANSTLEEARRRLRDDYVQRNKAEMADALLPLLTQSPTLHDRQELAKGLGVSEGAIKVALHRIRQKYGEVLRAVIAETVDNASDIDGEIDDMLRVLRD